MGNKFITKAPKRTKMQIVNDRMRIVDLLSMGHTQREIQKVINDEGGLNLSLTTIRNDIEFIKNDWRNKTIDNYDELMNRELDRIDSTEREVWRAWRNSCGDSEREIVERVAKEIEEAGGDTELVTSKITQIVDKNKGVGDPRFIDKIISLQQERRKLVGLYAPTKLGIDINKKSELIVKGYAVKEVSPDVWPDVVEGEIIEPERIEDKSGEK
jgi:hypothetical protein